MSPVAGDAFFEWLSVAEPTWGRTLAKRLADAQADCAKLEAPK